MEDIFKNGWYEQMNGDFIRLSHNKTKLKIQKRYLRDGKQFYAPMLIGKEKEMCFGWCGTNKEEYAYLLEDLVGLNHFPLSEALNVADIIADMNARFDKIEKSIKELL